MALPKDANYTVYLVAGDICGNHNITAIPGIVCEYYPHIKGLDSSVGILMGFAHLSSTVSGSDLESLNYSWFIDGTSVSSRMSLYTFLLPGSHNITFEAAYHGDTIRSVHHVFTFGFLPELAASVGLAAFVMYRRYGGDNDLDQAMEIVLKNVGRQRQEIFAIARRNRIRLKTVETAIVELASNGRIRIMPDPDGVMYVMGPKKNN